MGKFPNHENHMITEVAMMCISSWRLLDEEPMTGEAVKFKARIVARGFSQEYGIDYFHTYSPGARLTSLGTLLTIVAAEDLGLYQMDADTAFLNGTYSRKTSTWSSQILTRSKTRILQD
jgi:hypothetical protein